MVAGITTLTPHSMAALIKPSFTLPDSTKDLIEPCFLTKLIVSYKFSLVFCSLLNLSCPQVVPKTPFSRSKAAVSVPQKIAFTYPFLTKFSNAFRES